MTFFIILTILILLSCTAYLVHKMKQVPFIKRTKHKKITYVAFVFLILSCVLFLRSIFMGLFIYLLLFSIVADLIGIGLRAIGGKTYQIWNKIYFHGLLVVFLSILITIYGYISATNPTMTEYTIEVTKISEQEKPIHVFFVSDIHLGTAVKEKQMDTLLQKVKDYQPEYIFLGGDIADESSYESILDYSLEIFDQMQEIGKVYYVRGNHEGYKETINDYVDALSSIGIKVLEDETHLVDDRFYVIGRKDARYNQDIQVRAEISDLTQGIDSSKPIILLDHQPVDTEAAKDAGVDLQLSGHTHSGQIFPGSLISGLVNEVNYGHVKEEDYQILVSSGMGCWGFPMRVGTKAEMLSIIIK